METRRAPLAAAATSTVALAGCSAIPFWPGDGFRLCAIGLVNVHDEAHTVDLAVEADGEPVYWGGYRVAPRENGPDTVEVDPVAEFDGVARRLAVRARLDDREPVGPVEIIAEDAGVRKGESGETKLPLFVREDGDLTVDTRYACPGESRG